MKLSIDLRAWRRMSLKARSALVVAQVLLGVVTLVALSVINLRAEQLAERKHQIRSQVESAVSIADAFHKRAARGEMSEEAARRAALSAIAGMRWDKGTGYLFAFDSDMVMRMHAMKPALEGKSMADNKDAQGRPLFRMMLATDKAGGSGYTRYSWDKPGAGKAVEKLSYSQWFRPWDLHFGAGSYVDDIERGFFRALRMQLLGAAIIGLLIIAGLVLVMRGVLRTLGGEPAMALHLAERIADGDLRDSDGGPPPRTGSLMAAMLDMRVRLADMVSTVQASAAMVAESAAQIAQGNDDLSQRTQEQASSLEETASSMEEMAATVRQGLEGAQAASRLVQEAREQAIEGGETVTQAVAAMGEVDEASRRIADIIVMIDEIAFQTNLLALNAAVEAARAGEHGRGFAVVASEVRALSQRSASAAHEIKALIGASGEKVEAGSVLVRRSGDLLKGIVAQVHQIHDLVANVTAANGEQASGIDQVNHAVMQIDEATQSNAALVEEAAAASRAMLAQADALRRQMAHFRIDADEAPVASETDASRDAGGRDEAPVAEADMPADAVAA